MTHSIDLSSVIDVFRSLSKTDDLDDRAAVICRSAKDTIERQIKKDINCALHANRLSFAAGCLAFYRYVLSESANVISGFTLGDLKVQCDEKSIEAAKNIYLEAFGSISDLLVTRTFSFRSI